MHLVPTLVFGRADISDFPLKIILELTKTFKLNLTKDKAIRK